MFDEFLCDQKYSDEEDLPEKLAAFKEKYMEFDLNNEGEIDLMSLKRMMEKLGVPKTHLEMKKMISEVTGGVSDTISYRDFVNMMLGKRSAVLKLHTRVSVAKPHVTKFLNFFPPHSPSKDSQELPLGNICPVPNFSEIGTVNNHLHPRITVKSNKTSEEGTGMNRPVSVTNTKQAGSGGIPAMAPGRSWAKEHEPRGHAPYSVRPMASGGQEGARLQMVPQPSQTTPPRPSEVCGVTNPRRK
ncbi:hypothetical protein CB1_000576079 [Camelus ferus]|nr:hypothetical protein CB1_000576079 [Camelus ferus]